MSSLKSFKTFMSEADTSGATNMEKYIVISYNGGGVDQIKAQGVKPEDYKIHKPVADKIANAIKTKTGAPAGSMIHFGTGAGKTISWWKGNPTPKTDLYSTAGVNISLKQEGGSQLMSGFPDETRSTFRAAVEFLGANAPAETAKLVKQLEPVMRTVMVQGSINNLQAAAKTGKIAAKQQVKTTSGKEITVKIDKEQAKEEIADYIDWKKQMAAIQPKMTEFFNTNPEFRRWFVFEAATGATKFKPDPHAKANYVVEFNPSTGSSHVMSLGTKKPDRYIDMMAEKCVIRVSPKTATGSKVNKSGYGSTSFSFRLDMPEGSKKFKEYLAAKYKNILKESADSELLTAQAIFEHSRDVFLNSINECNYQLTTEGLIDAAIDWVKTTFSTIITKLYEIAKAGLDAVMDFLGYEVEKVEVHGDALMFFSA